MLGSSRGMADDAIRMGSDLADCVHATSKRARQYAACADFVLCHGSLRRLLAGEGFESKGLLFGHAEGSATGNAVDLVGD